MVAHTLPICSLGPGAPSGSVASTIKVRELVAESEVIEIVKWVATKENPSDLLSKGTIDPAQFGVLKSQIMSGISGATCAAPSAMAWSATPAQRAERRLKMLRWAA